MAVSSLHGWGLYRSSSQVAGETDCSASERRGRGALHQECSYRLGHARREYLLRTRAIRSGGLMRAIDDGREGVLPGNCNQMTGDGETVTPSLPEPGVWTGMAQANVWAPLRWKRAKIHRGSRRRILEAASRSRIYVSSCDCCTRSSQSVAIGRGTWHQADIARCLPVCPLSG